VLNEDSGEIEIYLSTKKEKVCCPKCGTITNKKKDSRTRILKHGSSNGKVCKLYLTYIRYKCCACKSSFYEDISDVCQKYYRYSNVNILNVMKNLSDFKMSVKDISKMSNMDYRLINRLFNLRVHQEGLNNIVNLPPNIGIDEFKGNMKSKVGNKKIRIKYQIQITNLDTGQVIAVLPIKSEKCISNFLDKIKNKRDVKNVAIDMSMQFKRTFKRAFKNANISIDYFHVTKLVTTAVDNIRLELWRKYKADKSAEAKEIRQYLKSLKHCLLTDYEACKKEVYKTKIDIKLKNIFKHCAILENAYKKLQEFYSIKRLESKEQKVEAFKKWLNSIDEIKEFKTVKKTMFHWYTYIKNAYLTGYSNGKTEGNNNSIKVLKRVSYGFSDFEIGRNRILICS
ncbi:MAG: ISL3 family transposase, partial [Clostridia bacterium]